MCLLDMWWHQIHLSYQEQALYKAFVTTKQILVKVAKSSYGCAISAPWPFNFAIPIVGFNYMQLILKVL